MAEEFDDSEIGDIDLDRPLRSRFSQFQLWSSSQIANVARRPTDLLVLAACSVGLILIFFLLPEDLLTGLSVNPGLRTVVTHAPHGIHRFDHLEPGHRRRQRAQ